MQQNSDVILPKAFYCEKQNVVSQVCVYQHCKFNAFICSDAQCQCQKHKKCRKIQIQKIITDIQNQKRKPSNQQLKSINFIMDSYTNIIEKFSQLRVQFLQSVQQLGIHKYSKKLINVLNNGKYDEIDGHFMSKVKFENQRKNEVGQFNIFDCWQIKVLWKQQQRKLNTIYETLKKFQISDNTRLFKKFDSRILDNRYKRTLLYFLPKQVQSFQLLYRATDHNFKANIFHNSCDETKDTVVIVENEFKNVIGGYTPYKWQNSSTKIENKTGQPFMFSLSRQQKYQLKYKNFKGILTNVSNGPEFGTYQNGIDLSINSNNKLAVSNFPASYGHQFFQVSNEEFTGQKNKKSFHIHQYEVFKLVWKES